MTEPKTTRNVDMISRQQAAKALNELARKKFDDKLVFLASYGRVIEDAVYLIEHLPPAQLDFYVTEKIDKAYDDGYNAGYLQGEFDARNEALDKDINAPSKSELDHIHNVVRDDAYKRGYEQGKAEEAPAIPLAWIDSYIKTCEIFDLRANVPASEVIKTMLKIWGQETQGK